MRTKEQDRELFSVIKKELYTAAVTDVMDKMGYQHQFLPAEIRPLREEMIIVGRAKTVQEADCCGEYTCYKNEKNAFGCMFEALDSLTENDIYVCTGSSLNYANFGGLMATRAMYCKAAGIVIDGYIRDTRELKDLNWPIFSRGSYAQDQGVRGRVIDYDCPIEFPNKVIVHPGDILFGDIDGVVAIPQEKENEIIEEALKKVRAENHLKDDLKNGMSTVDAFKEYGIM